MNHIRKEIGRRDVINGWTKGRVEDRELVAKMFERLRIEPDRLQIDEAIGKVAGYNSKTRRRAFIRLLIHNQEYDEIEKLASSCDDQTRCHIVNLLGASLQIQRNGNTERMLEILYRIYKEHPDTRAGRKVVQMLSNKLNRVEWVDGEVYSKITDTMNRIAEDIGISEGDLLRGLLRRTQEDGLRAKQAIE